MTESAKPFNPLTDVIIPLALLTVNCGNCGSFDYRLRVAPQNGRAKLVRIECFECGNILIVDDKGFLEGKGKSSFSPLLQITPGVKRNGR